MSLKNQKNGFVQPKKLHFHFKILFFLQLFCGMQRRVFLVKKLKT